MLRFNPVQERDRMNSWLSVNANKAENLYVTHGALNGTINMVVTSDEMGEACRELMNQFKNDIVKYAITYSGFIFINVELELKTREQENKLIDIWDSYFNKNSEWIKKKVV